MWRSRTMKWLAFLMSLMVGFLAGLALILLLSGCGAVATQVGCRLLVDRTYGCDKKPAEQAQK